jgi:hypothetical protein
MRRHPDEKSVWFPLSSEGELDRGT